MRVWRVRRARIVTVWFLSVWLIVPLSVVLAAIPAGAAWREPVDAPVVDSFRPPSTRFGAGNRGLEYGTVGGEIVVAVDDGRVTFAGAVGASRHVVVDHGSGLRSTYAFVQTTSVVRGQNVRAGDRVAIAAAGFHLTARLGDSYIDPMLLMAGGSVTAHLVADQLPTLDERRLNPWAAVFRASSDLQLSSQLSSLASAVGAWKHQTCTDDGIATSVGIDGPPVGSGRVLIQVGGLGSSSDGASIGQLDVASVGYSAADVVAFSYAGGCTSPFTPSRTESDTEAPTIEQTLSNAVGGVRYQPSDTFQTIELSAARLADLVDAVAVARPGQPIDVAAHSLGGVVARRALELLAERHPGRPGVDVMITISSPHGGADLATLAVATAGSEASSLLLDPILTSDGLDRTAQSVAELAEAGGFELGSPELPPDGVRVIAVAGATDLVVPPEHAVWDGAVNVMVPTTIDDGVSVHSNLPGRDEVARELSLAIAGMAPRCLGLMALVTSALQGHAISAAEDAATLAVGLARWLW